MTHLQHTCTAMANRQVLIERLAWYQRMYLARGNAEHAEAAQRLIRQHRDELANLGLGLMLHPAANDATSLPGAA